MSCSIINGILITIAVINGPKKKADAFPAIKYCNKIIIKNEYIAPLTVLCVFDIFFNIAKGIHNPMGIKKMHKGPKKAKSSAPYVVTDKKLAPISPKTFLCSRSP